MAKGRELKGSKYSITDQFPPEILPRRRLLYPIMTEALKSKKKVCLFIDKLFIVQKSRDNRLAHLNCLFLPL